MRTIVLLLMAAVFSGALDAQTYPLNQQVPPFGSGTATARQDGWRFRVNVAGVMVTHLTCYYPPAATTAHTVTIFAYPAGTVVAQTVVQPGAGWRNTALATSVPLTQGLEYIVSGWNANNSSLYTGTSASVPAGWLPSTAAAPIQYLDGRWSNGVTANNMPATLLTGSGIYGIADFGYTTGPTLNTSLPTVNLGATPEGTAGTPVSYTLTGSALTAVTDVTAPTGVEISFAQATGYAPTLQVTTFPAFGPTTIYARITSGAAVGAVNGNISHASTGATTKLIAASGNVVSLLASTNVLNAGFTTIGAPSAPVSFDLTGDGLVAASVVSAPAGFEVATNAAGPWGPLVNIPTTPAFAQTIYVRLDGQLVGSYAGDVTCTSAPATVLVNVTGDVFPPSNLHAQRHGPVANLRVDNSSQGGDKGLVLLDFSLSTIQAAWTVNDLTFGASGTADEQAGLSFLGLYEDSTTSGTGGVFDGQFVDAPAIAAPGTNFNGPNGTWTVVLTNGSWPAMTSRRFFLVCKLAGKALAGETIKAEIQSINYTTGGGGQLTGVPTAYPGDAFTINAADLTLSLMGPVVFQTVDNNNQGAGGEGLLACAVRLKPKNDGWTVNSLTFKQNGTMDGQADISFVGLYRDDGDAVWEGPATDVLATSAPGINFNGPSGLYTAGLTAGASAFGVNEARVFFLVVKLSGSASSGETLRVQVTAISHNSPSGGTMIGAPTGNTSALMIDQPTLTVNAGPGNPTTVTREKSAAGITELIGQVRLSARNAAFTVAGITLHTSGNGDWLNHLDTASGVQVLRDNGNGTFDAGDIVLFGGQGATPSVVCTFGVNQTIPVNTDLDLWIVLNLLASAGGSPYETFQAAIETPADVNATTAGGTVKIGTIAPTFGELRVVDFRVDMFSPTVDLFAGGGLVKIEGSGFALPVTVTVGGVACTGTPIVDAGGTVISGLSIPAGTGSNLAIVLSTNNLPPKTLTQTFRYSSVLPTNTTGGAVNPTNGCVGALGAPLAMLALPALAMVGLRRRRR